MIRINSKLISIIPLLIYFSGLSVSLTFAQTLPIQKKVISTYEVNNPGQLFPFPSSDCPDKSKGDANCDGNVNFFDLSIWQVEVSNPEGSKRSDFNADGFVDMTDYGIWRSTFYGSEPAPTNPLHTLLEKIGFFAHAQTQNPGTGNIQSSLPVTSANNSALILNQNSDGTSSEIRLDQNSNPAASLVFDADGNITAEANFTNTGDEWVTTSQDGIAIQTLKKAEGPVFQFFKDGTGTTIAVKSWPTLISLEQNDPPLSVTLPVKGSKWLTLNINPNGSSIVAQTDQSGNVLNQTQYRQDGTYISHNNQYQILTQSNDIIGLTTIEMPNALGGKTTYNFYKSGLYAIVQTDKANNYYIAKPADSGGDSWTLTSSLDSTEKTVSDPIAEVGSNTPDPKEIIANINYYKSLPASNNTINFTDGFGKNSRLYPNQTAKANEILKIESAATPVTQTNSWIFGIKEALAKVDAESDYILPKENDDNEGNSKSRTGGDDKDKSNSAGTSAAAAAPASNTQAKVGISPNTADIAVAANGTQTNKILGANGQEIASGTNNPNKNNAMSAGGSDVAVNSGYVARFVPSTPGGGTPTSEQPSGPTTCFLAGTKISTPKGPTAIETLKPGMKVYSYNEKTKQKEVADFAGLDINFIDEYLIVNDKIHTTTYHPFYVSRNGLLTLVKAGRLKVGDFLVDEANNIVPITSIQKVTKKETVYNLLTVTPNDNFYAEGILVHNYQPDEYTQGHNNNATENNDNSGVNSVSSEVF